MEATAIVGNATLTRRHVKIRVWVLVRSAIIVKVRFTRFLSEQQNLSSFTLQQGENVHKNTEDDALDVGLLLEDHSRQVEQHLIAAILQLRSFVDLCISNANAAELKVLCKDRLIVGRKAIGAIFVNHLRYSHDGAVKVEYWIAQHVARRVARLLVDRVRKARVLN